MKTKNFASLLAALGLVSIAGTAWADAAGRVLVAVGDVSAIRAGKTIALKLGSEVESGDTLHTGATSNAQIRLTDGSIIALRPLSEFRLDEYRFSGKNDGSEKGFFSLLKGGFRTVTGLIGKASRDNYRVTASAATIGIRGTNYKLVLCRKDCTNADGSEARDGLYGGVADGKIAVANETGDKDFGNDEFFFVASLQTPPESLVAPPDFLSDKLEGQARNGDRKGREDTGLAQTSLDFDGRTRIPEASNFTSLETHAPYAVTEDKDVSGGSAVLPEESTKHALVVAAASGESTYALSGVDYGMYPDHFEISDGTLLSYSMGYGEWTGHAGSNFADKGGAVVDGSKVFWGRWVYGSEYSYDSTDSVGIYGQLDVSIAPHSVSYMFGDASTTGDVIAGRSGCVNYWFVGGPSATDSQGNVGSPMDGHLAVNFTARTVTPNVSYSVGGSAYTISGFSMPIHDSGFGATGTGTCSGGGCYTATPTAVVMTGQFVGANGNGAISSVATYTPATERFTAAVGLFSATAPAP
ncbi:MAG: FecR family protein [Sulfuricella sp.]|nr:FecR family protein [Sulfuricella sp.]